MKNNKHRISESSKFKKCLYGTLCISLCFLTLSLICALVIYNTENPTSVIPIISMVSFITAGGVGTFINTKLFCASDFNSPLISAVITTILYILISAIASGGVSVGSIINSISITLASLLAIFIGKKRGRKPVHRKR